MKAIVDVDACIGCGLCTELCPEVFEMDDDKARAKPGDVPAEAEQSCRQAAEQCPTEAIKME